MTRTDDEKTDEDRPSIDPHDFVAVPALTAAYAEQRARCPVAHGDAYGGYYMLTAYPDVKAAAHDWESFSSADGTSLPKLPNPKVPPIEFDPPQHTFWRGVYRDLLSRPVRQQLEAGVVEQADRLIDRFASAGHADLFADYAEPIPVYAIAALIGLDLALAPEMRRLGFEISSARGDDAYRTAMGHFADFVLEQAGERRREPRADLLTSMSTDEFDGHRLADEQLVGALFGLMVAGHHSMFSALASLLLRVLTEPGLKEALIAEPKLVVRAVEETVRLDTPLHQFRRRTTTDVELHGVRIPADSSVALNYAAANRDPDVYSNPDEFDMTREASAHLGFGFGIHTCAGAPLARAELRLGLQRLLDRLPDITLVGPPPEPKFYGHLQILDRLDVRFTPPGSH